MVPTVVPGLVSSASAAVVASEACPRRAGSFANPKSRIFACPRSVRKMFAGLTSRWTMPFACAASSPSAI